MTFGLNPVRPAGPSSRTVYVTYVFDCSNNEVVDSNPARVSNICLSAFFCVVLSCLGRGLALGRSIVQVVLPKCMQGFVVSEVNSEWEETRGTNT